jgi:hypothetical protein
MMWVSKCRAHGEVNGVCTVSSEYPKGIGLLEGLDADEMIKWIVKKCGVKLRTGLNLFKVSCNGVLQTW